MRFEWASFGPHQTTAPEGQTAVITPEGTAPVDFYYRQVTGLISTPTLKPAEWSILTCHGLVHHNVRVTQPAPNEDAQASRH